MLWQPKDGHAEHEYEDAFAVSDAEGLPVHAAVADGATETAFAGAWARRLVQGFVDTHPEDAQALEAALPAWRAAWAEAAEGHGLPWYAAAKVEDGAFATLLGLTVRVDGTWTALSVGDCCLLHVRESQVRLTWPYTRPEQFTNRPDLIRSRSQPGGLQVATTAGTWQPGDRFVLATDALAAWMLRQHILPGWTQAEFERVTAAAREAHTLRNDDLTAVLLDLRAG